jgi:hypothetical protein
MHTNTKYIKVVVDSVVGFNFKIFTNVVQNISRLKDTVYVIKKAPAKKKAPNFADIFLCLSWPF